jgi:hypothetical protein
MVVSMEHECDPFSGPYYPTVARTARELLERSINGLDSVVLKQRLMNKIGDEFRISFANSAYPLLQYAGSG